MSSAPLTIDGVVTAIQVLLASLPNEATRAEVLGRVLENRCRKCSVSPYTPKSFDYDPNGNFWCCHDSRGG